ncbi:MAG: hypothetical protein LUC98_02000 [Lachnospiraceae bacterium]|nr:hypothetical protein [Lachnospiraceae bacterium]
MEEAKNCKVYVDVDVEFSSDGRMRPKWIRWKDGHIFEISRVKQCVRAASRKAGGVGLRYTVVIGGQESQLYYEENYRWFVEAKQPC